MSMYMRRILWSEKLLRNPDESVEEKDVLTMVNHGKSLNYKQYQFGDIFWRKQLSDWRKRSSPLSRHWFGSAIRGSCSRRSVKHSETSHWIMVHHRVSCGFYLHMACRFASLLIVLCRFVLCLALPLDRSIIDRNRRHVRGGDIMQFPWKPTATFDKRACLRRDLTKYTKVGHFVSQCLFSIILLPLEKDVLIFIVFMFWEHRWRNPDKAASHPEVAQWHSGSMKLRAWKTLKRDPSKKHGTTKEHMCRIKINLASNAYFVDALSYAYFAFAFITFSEVSNGGSHKILAPCAAKFSHVWSNHLESQNLQFVHPGTAQVFTPGTSALHPVFLPRLPTPSGTGLIRRSERASWANCTKIQTLGLEIGC